MARPLRQYEPIWIELKKSGYVRLAVPKPLHARTVKAVLKERTSDLEFRFLIREQNLRVFVQQRSNENLLELWLEKRKIICMETV